MICRMWSIANTLRLASLDALRVAGGVVVVS